MKDQPSKHALSDVDIAALKISEERLNRSQQFANIGTWDWDILNGDLYWSDRIWPLFGYDKKATATSYDNFLAAVHPDDKQNVINAVHNCIEHDITYHIEHRVVWPDESIHWVQEDGDVVRTEDGKPSHMLGVVQDIDARKRAELALAKNEQQLREAQKIAHVGSWQADVISGELTWSDEIYRIFGYEPGSFKPNVMAFHAAVHPDDRMLVHESEKDSEKTGRHDVVHRIIRPDGTVRYVHELAQAETDATGNLVRLTGTVQDITYQMEIKNDLINAKQEAEKANSAKSQFLSRMSHELRTPLNAILGFGQLLELDAEGLNETQKDNIRDILGGGHHLLNLINEILDLSKIESGALKLSLSDVNVSETVKMSTALVQPQADSRQIILFDKISDKGFFVRADMSRLKQALLNLLSNAVKYNREQGHITLDSKVIEGQRLRICITDSGEGLTQEEIEKLFTPFERLDASSNIEGTGIGLVITKHLVELMGGAVGVDSSKGEGSTFWVELPLANEAMQIQES